MMLRLFLLFVSLPVMAYDLPRSYVEEYRAESQLSVGTPLLNSRFPLDSKIELSGGASYSSYSTLKEFYAWNGSLVFHINRNHAIEPIFFASHQSSVSDWTKREFSGSSVELPKQHYVASYFYSPYYSKMSITQRSVAHFTFYFGAGFGFLKGQEVSTTGALGESFNRPTGVLSAGMRFLFPSRWALRLELRDFIHKSRDFSADSLSNTLQMTAMFSIFFGSFPKPSGT